MKKKHRTIYDYHNVWLKLKERRKLHNIVKNNLFLEIQKKIEIDEYGFFRIYHVNSNNKFIEYIFRFDIVRGRTRFYSNVTDFKNCSREIKIKYITKDISFKLGADYYEISRRKNTLVNKIFLKMESMVKDSIIKIIPVTHVNYKMVITVRIQSYEYNLLLIPKSDYYDIRWIGKVKTSIIELN